MKYITAVLFAFIEVAFTLAVLESASYDNKVLISGLIIIYASVRSIGISLGHSMNRMFTGLAFDLLKIKERIRKDEETEGELDKLEEVNKMVDVANIKLVIRSVGIFIIYVVGIINILG